jgi:hypothetical protein
MVQSEIMAAMEMQQELIAQFATRIQSILCFICVDTCACAMIVR